ncbi:MAG: ParA family protein [Bryobacterales bacterium]|nr:ParA family protein [Bryobacterales bacterium]
MTTIAFFNNKGGVGKTSLVYHLAWIFAERGLSVVAADLDPQANLTSMFLDEDRLEEVWPKGKHPLTVQGVIDPILRGMGDIQPPHVENIDGRIGLIIGDLGLSGFEDKLSASWPLCQNRDEAAFRTMTAFYRAALDAAIRREADVVLMDVGPNLGAINRSALIASRHVVIPLGSDLFSLQGLRNLGPQLRTWREAWKELRQKNPAPELELPSGDMEPVGYVVMQHAARSDRPVKAYLRWMEKIPAEYRESVLGVGAESAPPVAQDTNCLATLRHYRSLMPLAMEARKPMFFLKPADGAIGAHVEAVRDCYRDFERLAVRIAERCGLTLPELSSNWG